MSSSSSTPSSSTHHSHSSARSSPTNTCFQCKTSEYKYTCPGCSVRTCSLTCSKAHKSSTKCTGKRNRADYVPLNQYSWGSLMQDFTYLEEVNRLVSGVRRSELLDPTLKSGSIPLPPSKNSSAKRDHLVRKAAEAGVELKLMSDGMARRKMNMTCYNQKTENMRWSVELLFPSVPQDPALGSSEGLQPVQPSKPYTHMVHQVSSETTIISLLKQALNFKKLKLPKDQKLEFSKLAEDPDEAEEAREADLSDRLAFVLQIESIGKPEDVPLTSVRSVHTLAASSTLCQALKGTTILEWPRIEVWKASEWTSQSKLARVQILPKPSVVGRHSDCGWQNKRRRLEDPDHSFGAGESESSPVGLKDCDSKTLSQAKPVITRPTIATSEQAKIALESLLQYASSGDESS